MKKISDRYNYQGEENSDLDSTDDLEYRKRKSLKPKIDEDTDYYGYTDNNAGRGIDNDFSARPLGSMDDVGVFRKHKQNKAKLVRKRKIVKKIIKKCKCK